MLANKYEDARTRAQNVLTKDPRNVQAQIVLGNATAGMKDLDAAVADMEEAIRLDPARANTYANLGALQLARGKKEAAEAAFKKAVEIDPKSVPARLALANYYAASEQRPLAEQTLKEALAIEPKNLLTNRALALLAIADGHAADAEPYLQTMAAASDQPSVKLSVADYYMAMGRRDEAARLLETLAGTADMYVPAKVRLATLAASQNERARANQIVDEVLVHDRQGRECPRVEGPAAAGRRQARRGAREGQGGRRGGTAAGAGAIHPRPRLPGRRRSRQRAESVRRDAEPESPCRGRADAAGADPARDG